MAMLYQKQKQVIRNKNLYLYYMSKWIEYVKSVANDKNIKFNEALSIASKLYHEENGTIPKVKPIKMKYDKRLTGKLILKHLKRKLDGGELKPKMSKRDIIKVLRTE